MAGLDHHHTTPAEVRDRLSESYNARLGLILFSVYCTCYGAYVGINAFRPAMMDDVVFLGLNLAVLSGFALIAGALFLALVYMILCRSPQTQNGAQS